MAEPADTYKICRAVFFHGNENGFSEVGTQSFENITAQFFF